MHSEYFEFMQDSIAVVYRARTQVTVGWGGWGGKTTGLMTQLSGVIL